MIVREPLTQERDRFDAVATHPLQTWAWGDFRQAMGTEVIRLALFKEKNLTESFQITIHKIPHLGWRVGYFPKAGPPDEAQLFALKTAAEKYNLVFIKNEPNVFAPVEKATTDLESARNFLSEHQHRPGRPMFTKYSFILALRPSESELFANLKPKTRYNINLAQKRGVTIVQDDSDQTFQDYLNLLKQTTKRQAFYSHTEKYHRLMWQHLHQAGIAHLIKAVYQNQTLAVWVLFLHRNTLYYPYGASSRDHKDVMANNLLAWEAIKFGQAHQATSFDMWGSLGPEPDTNDPWYGFHRFKQGYSGQLMEFVGTYDYILDPQRYQLYTILDKLRWQYLNFRARLPF